MFSLKLSRFGVVAILAALGAQNLVGEDRRTPPLLLRAASAAPQFRPLTEANVQDALVQVKAAVAALDRRFATAGTSADGWKEYLSWDKFKSELQKVRPDNAVLKDTYDKLAAGYDGLELKWFANLRTALGSTWFVAAWVGNPGLEAKFKGHVDELTQQIKSLSARTRLPTKPNRLPTISSGWRPSGKRRNWFGRSTSGSPNRTSTPSLAASCSARASAGRSMSSHRSTT